MNACATLIVAQLLCVWWNHCSGVAWSSYRLKSPKVRLFVQQSTHIQRHIQNSILLALCEVNLVVIRGVPHTGSVMLKVFSCVHIMIVLQWLYGKNNFLCFLKPDMRLFFFLFNWLFTKYPTIFGKPFTSINSHNDKWMRNVAMFKYETHGLYILCCLCRPEWLFYRCIAHHNYWAIHNHGMVC